MDYILIPIHQAFPDLHYLWHANSAIPISFISRTAHCFVLIVVINKESSEIPDQLDRHKHKLLNDTLFHEIFYFLWHRNYKPTHFPIISLKFRKFKIPIQTSEIWSNIVSFLHLTIDFDTKARFKITFTWNRHVKIMTHPA